MFTEDLTAQMRLITIVIPGYTTIVRSYVHGRFNCSDATDYYCYTWLYYYCEILCSREILTARYILQSSRGPLP